jgi:hypothetical protein
MMEWLVAYLLVGMVVMSLLGTAVPAPAYASLLAGLLWPIPVLWLAFMTLRDNLTGRK